MACHQASGPSHFVGCMTAADHGGVATARGTTLRATSVACGRDKGAHRQ